MSSSTSTAKAVSGNATSVPAPENVVLTPSPSRPKPCCVCNEEKAVRDECMLFSEKGAAQCLSQIEEYKKCMAGYGFKI